MVEVNKCPEAKNSKKFIVKLLSDYFKQNGEWKELKKLKVVCQLYNFHP